MSRLSELIRARYGKGNETAEQIIKRYLGEHTQQFKEIAKVLIAAIDMESMSGKQKQAYVRALLKGLAKLLLKNRGINIPDWALNSFIDYLVAQLRIGEGEEQEQPEPEPEPEPEPTPEPDPEPTDLRYETELTSEPDWTQYQNGDKVQTNSAEDPSIWWVTPVNKRAMFPTYLRVAYGVVEDGSLTLLTNPGV